VRESSARDFNRFRKGKDTQAETLAWVRYGVRRSGSYDCCPLNGVVETRILGFWVNPTASVARRAQRGADRAAGADSGVPRDDRENVRGRNARGKGSNSRRKSATGVRTRGTGASLFTQRRASMKWAETPSYASLSVGTPRRHSAEARASE
jgi:hypothetical protein